MTTQKTGVSGVSQLLSQLNQLTQLSQLTKQNVQPLKTPAVQRCPSSHAETQVLAKSLTGFLFT